MKAVIQSQYGPPELLQLAEVEKPTPNDHQVLIRVHAVSVNGSDWEGLTGKPLYARVGGLFKPASPILGGDVAGRVEAAGKDVTLFQPGDEVFGETLRYRDGFAEYVCVSQKALAVKPAGLTFAQASAIPQAGVIAVQAIRDKGQVQPGQHVLINGAGGGAGTFAVQLAKYYGAEVTGVDNAGKLDYLRSIGADHAVDYTRQRYTKNRGQYDLIVDLSAHRSVFAVQRALKPGGRYYVVGGAVGVLLQVVLFGPLIRKVWGKQVKVLAVTPNRKDLEFITELCAAGKITPVIDRAFSLSQVPEALRLVGEGRARGKIVIVME